MKYFNTFTSNTCAGSGNQHYFNMDDNEVRTGRIFYKITVGGAYSYSVLFSNIIDSTFNNGEISYKNLICDSWMIHSARVGKCTFFNSTKDLSEIIINDKDETPDVLISGFKDLYFGGQKSKEVMPGEFFSSDPCPFECESGEYLCLEITFSGNMIPYHEETLLPVYIKGNDGWKYSRYMPFSGMIGCDRTIKKSVAFLGDSITQGLGTKPNSYSHWTALLAKKLGDEYSFWNLGLGYGRAGDIASGGAWMYKAIQNDIIFVCFGVNDILKGHSADQIKTDLTYTVDFLKSKGRTVILQTIPPFNYTEDNIKKWKDINEYIMTKLSSKADFVFDNTLCLGEKDSPEKATYGAHPNEAGCEIWANMLYEKIKDLNFFK